MIDLGLGDELAQVQRAAHVDVEPGFLKHFARTGVFQFLAVFDQPARQEVPGAPGVLGADQQHVLSVQDDRAGGDQRMSFVSHET